MRKTDNYYLLLLDVLNDWRRKKEKPTVGALIDACILADVGGEATRLLNYKDGGRR